MDRLREIYLAITRHRAFAPVLIGVLAITFGLVLGFEHSRNLVKVRAPYLVVLGGVTIAPIFAFRFFDPHEPWRPISYYFIIASIYFIALGSPDAIGFLAKLLRSRVTGTAIKQLILGFFAFGAIAGTLHFALNLFLPPKEDETRAPFLSISVVKFLVYAILHLVYINLAVAMVRQQFGMSLG
jgi:hypothetical protein